MIYTSKFKNTAQLFKFLKENKTQLISQKKFEMKRADVTTHCVSYPAVDDAHKDDAHKSADNDVQYLLSKDKLKVRVVINTTKLLDSHNDVHINGIWKKSIKELKQIYLLQEHQMKFDHVISDEVKVSVKKTTWKELGFDFEGDTEALIFDCEIEKARNPFMFEQYARGYVKNHSVGMKYVQIHLCINSDEKYTIEEKANWDKYIVEVANQDAALEKGYFWAVTEAKIAEGSAVLMGSNYATPTQEVKETEPPLGTPDTEPAPPLKTNMFSKFKNLKTN